jgi:tripartite-type tricarboxylate transporter receptor subunit TctC
MDMTTLWGRRAALAWVAGLGAGLMPAHAQTFPSKAITIINPFAAGGPADLIARAAAKVLSENLGQPVVIDYKAGGGGSIGAGLAAKAVPDGHTLFLGTSAAHVVNPLVQKTSYDGIKDFEFLGIVANTVNVLVVHPSVPAKNLAEFIALAKSQPGKLNYGSAGQGTTGHLGMELLKLNAGVFIVHVPYRGAAPAVNDLLGGAVQAAMPNLSVVLPMIKAGRLQALAVATTKRSAQLPDVPTLAEAGIANAEYLFWIGMLVPVKTPRDVVNRLNQATQRALATPEVRERLASQGAEPLPMSPEQFDAMIREEMAANAAIIKAAGIKID